MGRARVWLQALPDCSYTANEVLERKVPVVGTAQASARRAAIEAFAPRGAYCPYGLLGAEFVPDLSGAMTIQVMISTGNLDVLQGVIPGTITDTVRRGLPSEYADSVFDGAIQGNLDAPLGSGVLQFNCAAHGEAGSSRRVFRQLSEVVTRLVGIDPSSVTMEQLLSLIDHKV
ncbi:MAG TPA: hypothetical protein VFJ58_12765 [Armatimonadota bacterium]|nr:hypothetical protein [Armatimonadota bacterium]